MATLAEIRAKLLEQETRRGPGTGTGDNAIYTFWNIPENTTATLRFLPDGDTENTFFWRERQMIRLAFPGVKGHDESRSVTVQVPCVEMWGDACPVHAEIRPWFKDTSMEDIARKYWKKRSYLFQGFVIENPLAEDETPENPIRRFVINPSIYKIIAAALMDPDFVEIPTDYEQGTDFRLTKTQQGQYADYSTSNWARRDRSLNEEERQAIESNGLFNLNDFMPRRPSEDDVKVIFEMFEASVDGQLYDPDRFGQHYRPFGLNVDNGNGKKPAQAASTPAPAPQPAVEKTEETVVETPAADPVTTEGAKPSAQDILKMIRSRQS